MPAVSGADFSVISLENSAHGINLGPNGFFNGDIVDVSDYTTITISAAGNVPPAAADAIQIEWYDADGVFVSLSLFGSDASTFQTVHGVVRTKFMRVRYHAAATGQTNLHLETLFRKGNVSGSVTRVGLITGSPDAQIVNSVTMGKLVGGTYQAVRGRPDLNVATDTNLIVVPPLPHFTTFQSTVTASLASVQLNVGDFGNLNRRWMTVFNDTERGSLYIRPTVAPTLTNYAWKIPPQHTFSLPMSWPMFGGAPLNGRLFGIWDVADGFARMSEGA